MSDKSKKELEEKYEWLQFSSAARPRTDETLCLWEDISISMQLEIQGQALEEGAQNLRESDSATPSGLSRARGVINGI